MFRLTANNAAAVAELCAHLDGLPLALELAAAHVRALPPAALLPRLARQFDLLRGTADAPDRQQSLSATVAWSYQLLPPDEQRVFRRLGALQGRFPIEAAAAVLADREDSPVPIDRALRAAHGDGTTRRRHSFPRR